MHNPEQWFKSVAADGVPLPVAFYKKFVAREQLVLDPATLAAQDRATAIADFLSDPSPKETLAIQVRYEIKGPFNLKCRIEDGGNLVLVVANDDKRGRKVEITKDEIDWMANRIRADVTHHTKLVMQEFAGRGLSKGVMAIAIADHVREDTHTEIANQICGKFHDAKIVLNADSMRRIVTLLGVLCPDKLSIPVAVERKLGSLKYQ